MDLKLKIKSGPLQGKEFPLNVGDVIGRSSAEITLNDPKISGRHAKIEKGPFEELQMIDLGSTNGLRVDDKKVMQVTLTPGLIIKLGNTLCEVIGFDNLAPAVEPSDHKPPSLPLKTPPKPSDWPDYFVDFVKHALNKISNTPQAVAPFKPILVLRITHGLQAGTEWVLGYGPRTIGCGGLDLHVFDPLAPPFAFKVLPEGAHARYITEFPQEVRLNDRAISSEVLNDGDEIAFADTRIKVSFR